MAHGWVRAFGTLFLALVLSVSAFAQGSSTASISGVVVDRDGGVIPGATIVVTNTKTGETFNAVSTGAGTFSVPALITGTYTVSISLEGFKTALLNNVVVNSGVPASVRATLEVGGLTEQVTVQANSELVQTQSATVSTVLDTKAVASLPLSSRDASQFIVFLPGVTSPGSSRDSIVNGLPQSTINMTIDGVNIQDNTLKTTDGFFALVSPRIDAIEEISFTSAASGSDNTGSGATQIRYTTKSGTNEFRGGIFHQYRSDALNSNTWFNKRDNLPKNPLKQNQPGFSIGGPVRLPGFDGRNRAFFFVNYEEFRSPGATRRDRTILHPDSQAGVFRYSAGGGVQTVNLFELAARNGQTSTADPLIAKLLSDIRQSTTTTGNVRDLTDPLYQQFSFLVPTTSMNRYPTGRLDYQLSEKHRLTYSFNFQYIGGGPDTTNNRENFFPGFPVQGNQSSTRRATSGWLRSVLSPTMVNEFRIGYGGGPVIFAQNDFKPEMWNGTLANQGGYYLNFANTLTSLTNAGANGTTSGRDAYHWTFEDTINWQKGAHSINTGALLANYTLWQQNQTIIPELRFDVLTGDPAEAMFVTANFAGASNAQITNAKRLYAILTGRVSEIRNTARLDPSGTYQLLGQGEQRARQQQLGMWLQDSWHVNPNLTLNYGARYDLSFPFVALNDSYSIGDLDDVYGVSGTGNLFKPGTLTGTPPTFRQLKKGERAYPMDWNNVSPSIGMAWTPNARGGLLRTITGQTGDFVVRAGYSRSYTRLGLTDFAGQVANNPGVSIAVNRTQTLGNIGPLPLLMRNGNLSMAAFPSHFEEPFTEVTSGDITIFSPDLVVPYSDTWQAGVQRQISKTMSIEARYLGARSADSWRTDNYNEVNIIENGFLDEFKLAMANLQANNAAGGTRAGSFAYFGSGTGTVPLPIMLAYFNGVSASGAGNAAAYTSTNFRSATYVDTLARFNPHPYSFAQSLRDNESLRTLAITAGLPRNHLVANPDLLGGANIVENRGRTMYNSLALELKRRSNGLAFQSSYVLGHAMQSNFLSLRVDDPMLRNGGEEGDVTHALKLNLVYQLPFGRGQHFGSNVNGVVDRIIGGWQLAFNSRVQSGRLLDLGNVRLVGMDAKELRDNFKVRIDDQNRVFMLPQDIIDNTFKAFSVSATSATGYGSNGPPTGRYLAPADSFDCIESIRGEGKCGVQSLIVQGPMYQQHDLSIVKRIGMVGRVSAEFRLDALNVFDNVNFSPQPGVTVSSTGTSANFNRAVGSSQTAYETTALTGVNTSRILQIVSRLRW